MDFWSVFKFVSGIKKGNEVIQFEYDRYRIDDFIS